MCMIFGCSPQINFCYIFRSLNLVFFGRLLVSTKAYVNATPPTILAESLLNFALSLQMVLIRSENVHEVWL